MNAYQVSDAVFKDAQKKARAEKKEKEKIYKLIDQAYNRTCCGITINIMDIGRVFKAGEAAYAAGARDAELDKAVFEFVQTIRRD